MSQRSSAIVAQPSSSAKALKRSATPRGRDAAAKKAKGIEQKLPWSCLDRKETRVARDEDGEHQKQVIISRQRALLKAGASMASREAARGDAFGGSLVVQEAHEQAARDVASGGGNQAVTADGYDYMVKSFESWAMFALPDDHREHARVKAMDDALQRLDRNEAGFSIHDVDLHPACPHALLTFLHVIADQDATERKCESSAFQGKTYKGRATGFTNASRVVTAQKKMDMNLCGYSHAESVAIKNLLNKMGVDYVPTSAPGYDVATGLPLMREACFAPERDGFRNPFNTGIQRQQMWTMVLWSHAVLARGCLFSTFCPMINQLDIPSDARTPGEGLPAFIKLKLTRWKHNHSGKRQQYLLIHRNRANPKFCPVIAMLFWLKTLEANGIRDGPLFPALNNAHDEFLRSEVDGVMHLERMSAHTFNSWTRHLFVYAGGELEECTHHSIRRACVKWAARCGASEHDIKRAGRWKTSSERFAQYWGDGQTSLEELEIMRTNNPNFVDPIYAVWRWRPIAFEASRVGGDG
jgi:hypothetical protein